MKLSLFFVNQHQSPVSGAITFAHVTIEQQFCMTKRRIMLKVSKVLAVCYAALNHEMNLIRLSQSEHFKKSC